MRKLIDDIFIYIAIRYNVGLIEPEVIKVPKMKDLKEFSYRENQSCERAPSKH